MSYVSHCLDTNEDGILDENELEALFTKEVWNGTQSILLNFFHPTFFLKNPAKAADSCLLFFLFFFKLEKVYDPNNAEDDMMEMEEERLRMREHFMNNVSLQVVFCLDHVSNNFVTVCK